MPVVFRQHDLSRDTVLPAVTPGTLHKRRRLREARGRSVSTLMERVADVIMAKYTMTNYTLACLGAELDLRTMPVRCQRYCYGIESRIGLAPRLDSR